MLAAHHPYFLPWLGYFSKIYHSEQFVFLDDVGFRRNHIKRVKIFGTNRSIEWITVPVGSNWSKSCLDVYLPSNRKFIKKILNTLYLSYKNAPYFNGEYELLDELLLNAFLDNELLVDANIQIIRNIWCRLSSKNIKFHRSSEINSIEDRTDRLIHFAEKTGCNSLLSGDGKMTEVHDLNRFNTAGITMYQQPYFTFHPVYDQFHTRVLGKKFTKGLSICDALFNIGAHNTLNLVAGHGINIIEIDCKL